MADDPTLRRYLRHYVGWLAVAFGLLGVNNVVIDPNGYLPVPAIPGFNAVKYAAEQSRIQKSVRIAHGDFDTLVMGTSRALTGIDPAHPSLAGRRVYNGSLRGSNVYEMEKVLDFARAEQDLDLLIWGLDFLAFSTRRTVRADFSESLFESPRDPTWLISYLFSSDTAERAWKTVRKNRRARARLRFDAASGFLDRTGSEVDHGEAFTRVLTENFLVKAETYGDFQYGTDRVERLERVLDRLAADGTNIVLFVSPVHARQLETLRALSLFAGFEDWKRDLSRVVARVERRRKLEIPLWDFSGYNSITTEEVPTGGEPMRWYWESSHYKKETGGLVLDRILEVRSAQAPPDFGVRLSSANVEQTLARQRVARSRYADAHQDEIAEIARLAEATRETREANRRRAGRQL